MSIAFVAAETYANPSSTGLCRRRFDDEACVELSDDNAFALAGEMILKVTGEPMHHSGNIWPERVGVFLQHLHRAICVATQARGNRCDEVQRLEQLERVARIAYRKELAVSWG